jgi:hypothetical protein
MGNVGSSLIYEYDHSYLNLNKAVTGTRMSSNSVEVFINHVSATAALSI